MKSGLVYIRALLSSSKQLSIPFKEEVIGHDVAYASRLSMSQTISVRGFLHVMNDMIYIRSKELKLNDIPSPDEIKEDMIDTEDVTKALEIEENDTLILYISEITAQLVKFDWRTASTPNLDRATRQKQMIYKGSSGYREIRSEILRPRIPLKIKKWLKVHTF